MPENSIWTTMKEYERCLHGYSFTDCVVRSRLAFTFVAARFLTDAELQQEEQQMESPAFRDKRVLPFFLDAPEDTRWSFTTLHSWDLLTGGSASIPLNQFVGVDLEGTVFVAGSGVSGMEDPIPSYREGGPSRGGIRKVRNIGGHAYACGGGRTVCRRTGPGAWHSYTQSIPDPDEIGRTGFQDIDGFGPDDLYAAGGKADVWHFDGKRWQPVVIPANTWVEAVCCGGDGLVYLALDEGRIVAGRGNKWRMLSSAPVANIGFRDLVWYEDRVWCCDDYGIWQIAGNQVRRAELPSWVAVCAGHLDANDGVLLSAGLGGAAFCQYGQWHSIVLRPEMENATRAQSAR